MCEPMEKKNPVGSIDKEDLATGLALSLQKNASCGHPLGSYAKGKARKRATFDIVSSWTDQPIVNSKSLTGSCRNNGDIVDLGRARPLWVCGSNERGDSMSVNRHSPGFFSLSCSFSGYKELRCQGLVVSQQFLRREGAHKPCGKADSYLIVGIGGTVPDSHFESFLKLGSIHVMDHELTRSLAPSAGLRKRLVHNYDDIDDSIVYDSAKPATRLYTEYVRSIKNYVDLNN